MILNAKHKVLVIVLCLIFNTMYSQVVENPKEYLNSKRIPLTEFLNALGIIAQGVFF